jgi:hypothetical protein
VWVTRTRRLRNNRCMAPITGFSLICTYFSHLHEFLRFYLFAHLGVLQQLDIIIWGLFRRGNVRIAVAIAELGKR